MKAYIGKVDNTGHIFMLAADGKSIVPHVTGGTNKKGGEFVSYEMENVNKKILDKYGLRALTKQEAALFMAGKDIHGNKVESPAEIAAKHGWDY